MRFLIIVLFFSLSLFAGELHFTKEESAYIKAHPLLLLSANNSFAPYDFANIKGEHIGVAADFLDLISRKSGLNIKVVPDKWYKSVERMRSKKTEGFSCITKTPERAEFLFFTKPYLSMPLVVVTSKEQEEIASLSDLEDKVVAIDEDSHLYAWLSEKYPKIKLLLSASDDDALENVVLGNADAYIGDIAVAEYIIKHTFLTNLKIVMQIPNIQTAFSIAIDKERPLLFSIVQKSLDAVTEEEREKIFNKWLKPLLKDRADRKLSFFTKEERAWIASHKEIVCTTKEKSPFLIVEGNRVGGIIGEYLLLFEKRIGIKFLYKPFESTLDADLFFSVDESSYVNRDGLKSKALFSFPFVAVTKKEKPFVDTIEDIKEKSVALLKNSAGYAFLKRYKDIKVVSTDSVLEALKAVEDGKVYAFLGDMATAVYYVERYYPKRLHIAGELGPKFYYRATVRRDEPLFLDILNKVIETTTDTQRQNIANRWLYLHEKKSQNYNLVLMVVSLLALFISFYLGIRLYKEKRERRRVESELNQLKERF